MQLLARRRQSRKRESGRGGFDKGDHVRRFDAMGRFAWGDPRLYDLTGGSLREANLTDATLKNANLREANLIDTTLENADLTGANLRGAVLIGTRLSNTNFTDITCQRTTFSRLDMSSVTGLETADHLGPSIVDMQTIYLSGGQISQSFLRGCGVPEDFFAHRLGMETAFDRHEYYLNYAHKDTPIVQRICDELRENGFRCWLYRQGRNPYDQYLALPGGLTPKGKEIVCMSRETDREWLSEKTIDRILAGHFEYQTDPQSIFVINLDDFLFSDAFTNPNKSALQSRLAADFKGWEHDNAIFEREIERVIRALRADGGRSAPPPSKL